MRIVFSMSSSSRFTISIRRRWVVISSGFMRTRAVMRTLFYETFSRKEALYDACFWGAQPLLRKRVSLPTSDTEEQKDDEVADNGNETDEVDAALLDVLALFGRGGQRTYNHLSRDLEEPGEAVDALRKAVKVF